MVPSELAIDACCLLNLLATSREVEIVTTLNVVLVTTPKARSEVLYLGGPPDGEGQPTITSADASALEASGRLIVRALSATVTDTFVATAEALRDADASVVVLAASQKLPLASDDRKLRNHVQSAFPTLELRGTLWIVRAVAERAGWDDRTLRAVALNLRTRGSFLPPKKDPNAEWFAALLRR